MIDVLEIFEETTQYNLKKYLQRVDSFVKVLYPKIVNFYSSTSLTSTSIKDSVIVLDELLGEADTILSIIQNFNSSLDSRFWDIVELVDDIKLNLLAVQNTPKWLRSTLSKGTSSSGFEVSELLKQRETLELLSKRIGSSDKENDWSLIALRNDLSEEEYSPDGGISLVVQYFNRFSLSLKSVVDSSIVGEKVYGLDIKRELNFKDGDLEVLTYKETVLQAVTILAKLRQGDNPQFIENGIQSSLVIGSNRNSIPFNILLRQLYSTFQSDDTLKSLRIINIDNIDNRIELSLEVETRISEVVENSIVL